MKLALFACCVATVMFAQATDAALPPPINSAYAYKDLTVAGVLLVAVIYLYRELLRERKNGEARDEARDEALKVFVATQSAAFKEATDSQSTALGEVAQALGKQQASLEEFITIQRVHINRILDAATKAKDG